jgi:transcriptional regulator with XRE-family HTH domain
VGRQIAELRRACGLSESQLAERAQLSVQVVRRVERGQDITLGALARLASGLGAKIEIQLAP